MDNSEIELMGGPCGQHGPYTFYKAFKYNKNGCSRIISLSEFFFVKLWSDSDLVCIGELQLLWIDKNSEQMLASLRLYFLPENTPEGRLDHGEDEVLAISEKVVLRLEDLLTWVTVDTEWNWGRPGVWECDVTAPVKEEDKVNALPLTDSTLDFADIQKEKKLIGDCRAKGPSVVVLSYPRYCRYRALMKRVEGVEDKWLKNSLVIALGGFSVQCKNTRVLFCKDTFDYPDLEGHELLCNHLAPKLKGRPRGKRKKRSISPGGSESNESESSVGISTNSSIKTRLTTAGGRNGLRCNSTTSPRRSTRSTENIEEREFLNKLHVFMKSHRTPIGRIPSIGYKEIDLYAFFAKVQKIGGYESATANRMWKPIFDELGGNQHSTSAATIMRRHYERLLLPYERHIKGEEYKPLPTSERRRLKSKANSFSDAETSEGDRSSSGHSTPVSQSAVPAATTSATPSTPTDTRELHVVEKSKPEAGKISSLRSVRVKSDRMREQSQRDKAPSAATSCKPTTSGLPDKNNLNVPVTTAVAPVAEKPVIDKSASPLEGRENVPDNICLAQTESSKAEARDANTPEIIDLDRCESPPATKTLIFDVKKQKLDILKEGGLEVTAVSNVSDVHRPSVIQNQVVAAVAKHEIGNLSITVTSDVRRMPPPATIRSPQSPKKAPYSCSIRTIPEVYRRGADPKPAPSKYLNGQSPPKVVQSRSIYSYSESIVYGNPKDPFFPPTEQPRHLVRQPPKPHGGDVLDLTVKSPHKPIVEIMRVPSVPLASRTQPGKHSKSSNVPQLMDGRVGSNLEITLVSNKGGQKMAPPCSNQRQPQKRSSSGKFVSSKTENGRPHHQDASYSSLYSQAASSEQLQSSSANPYMQPMFPSFMSQLTGGAKNMPPSYLPVLDPAYYSMINPQNMYAAPHLFPVHSVGHLDIYKEMLARVTRNQMPFHFMHDANPNLTAALQTDHAHMKK